MPFPRDDMASKLAFYGDPRGPNAEVSKKWYAANIIRVKPPFKMYYAGKIVSSIAFHKKAAKELAAALEKIWSECERNQQAIDHHGMSEFGGSFNYRLIRNSHNLSNHAFGIAIDINTTGNELGKTKGDMPAFAVKAFKDQGFKWGGDYKGRKDWMHMEAVS